MTKSTRLLQLLHILRHRSKRPATAAKLAAELGISPRTLYRDIEHLSVPRSVFHIGVWVLIKTLKVK